MVDFSNLADLAGVAGDLGGAYLGYQSAQDAAEARAKAAEQAIRVSQQAVTQGRTDVVNASTPGLDDIMYGIQGGVNQIQDPGSAEMMARRMTGIEGAEAEQTEMDNFLESPGQEYLRNEQERALLRNSAAMGGIGGGNVRKALQSDAYGRASTNLQQRFNNVSSMVTPESTRDTNIANMLSQGGRDLAQFRGGIGTSLANLAVGGSAQQIPLYGERGDAQAAGEVGGATAINQGLSSLGKSLGEIFNS